MISANDLPNITKLLSNIFFYGLSKEYSPFAIEEKITSNSYFASLESGNGDFLINENLDRVIKSMFEEPFDEDSLLKTNALALWLGEIYTKLFFSFNKSFSFLFLYLPISKAERLFPLYHEMDISQVVEYFKKLVNEENILTLLLRKKGLTIRELSALTGVNYNTLISFTRDNEFIYNAKFDSIYRISQVLHVNINTFVRYINNFTSSEMFDFDKRNQKYRSFLGLFLAEYYSNDVQTAKYQYDEINNIFISKNKQLKALWTEITSDPRASEEENVDIASVIRDYANQVPKQKRKDHTLIVFEYNQISENVKTYLNLLDYGFDKIFIINSRNILCVSNKSWIERLGYSVSVAMINKAKHTIGGDFAV